MFLVLPTLGHVFFYCVFLEFLSDFEVLFVSLVVSLFFSLVLLNLGLGKYVF